MQTYHKINSPFMRYTEGKKKGRLIIGEWAQPEFEYLANNQWEYTEKVDGTNVVVRWGDEDGLEFGGRTPKTTHPTYLMDILNKMFTWDKVYDALGESDHDRTVYLYGEGYGPKIQKAMGEKYRADEHSFVLFDVNIDGHWLYRKDVDDIAQKLGIESVPVIGHGTLQDAIHIVTDGITFNERGGVVRWGSGGLQSAWGNFEAEGIVARPVVPLFDRAGRRIITKIKGVDFK